MTYSIWFSYHKLLTLLETPQERRQSADVHSVRQNRHKMVQNSSDFAKKGPDVLGADGDVDVQQLLDSQGEALLVGHHGDVVQTVKVGQGLQICPVLDELLCATVQQADVGVGAHNLLAVELQDQAQHAVGGRMLGTEVDGVMPDLPRIDVVVLLDGARGAGRLGVDGPTKVLVGLDQTCPLGLVHLGIPARQRGREAARNGP